MSNYKLLQKGLLPIALSLISLASTGQVLITEIVDPTNSASSRYVELYNAGAASIDLTGWNLQLYSNANTSVTNNNILNGVLAPGAYYIVAQDGATFLNTYGINADLDGNVNANGDDNFQLRDDAGNLVDEYGVVGEDGTGTCHEFEDGRAERAATVTGPNPVWNEAEWNVTADSGPGTGVSCTNFVNVGSSGLSAPSDYDPGFWIGSGAPSCGFSVNSSNVTSVCDAVNVGPGDTYTLSIPYTGIDAGVTVVNNTASGTIAGDDPALVTDGTIVINGIDEGDAYSVTFTAPCDNITVSGAAPTCDPLPALIINEIHADPSNASGLAGDANGDGSVDSTDDEFVEIVNNDVVDVDISGFTLSDAVSVRHTFDAGTIIPAGCAIVVFGGGTPTGPFGGALTVVASSGQVGLNNGGDNVILQNATGTTIDEVLSYSGAGSNQSITLDPDITGTSFVQHSTATGNGGTLYSPGTLIDGSNFSGCAVPACNVSFQTETAACETSAPGPGDTYQLSIPYVGVQAGITVINNSGSGTVGGDDPATVANGTIVVTGIDEASGYDIALSTPCDAITLTGSAPTCEVAYTIVINEVDYDQPGADDAEFIELKNIGPDAVDITGMVVEFINGNNGGASVGNTITIASATLAAGDYYVICKDGTLTANCDQVESGLAMQNGAPDGLGLKDPQGNLVDAVSYEGDCGAPYTEGSGVGLEDSGASGNDDLGISRFPDGVDTDVNNADLSARCITPGMANDMQNSFCVCEPPTVSISTSCADANSFNIVVNVTALGSSATVDISDDQFVAFLFGVGTGTYTVGPYANNTIVELTVNHDAFTQCNVVIAGITDDCTPMGPCTENEVELDITTDDFPGEIIWNIYEAGSSTSVCNGGPYFTQFGNFIEPCCLADGSYDLIFTDGFGDGINPGGGFQLKDPNGNLIIGAEGIITGGGSVPTYGQSFSLPIGSVKLYPYFCDRRDYLPTDFVVAQPDPAVSAEFGTGDQTDDGYQFWFFDPFTGYSRRIFLSHANPAQGAAPGSAAAAHCRFDIMVTNPVPANTLLNCRVRSRVNGINGAFGPSCFVQIDAVAAACPVTQLIDDPANQFFSCGVTRSFGSNEKIHAQPVNGATDYKFRFENVSEGFVRNIKLPTYACVLNWTTKPLTVGGIYEVTVQASLDNGATYCPFGAACQVTITSAPVPQFRAATINTSFNVWPNPSNGSVVNVSLTQLEEGVTANVELYSASGKLLRSQQLSNAQQNSVVTFDALGSLPSGLYMVRCIAGSQQFMKQVMIQN